MRRPGVRGRCFAFAASGAGERGGGPVEEIAPPALTEVVGARGEADAALANGPISVIAG